MARFLQVSQQATPCYFELIGPKALEATNVPQPTTWSKTNSCESVTQVLGRALPPEVLRGLHMFCVCVPTRLPHLISSHLISPQLNSPHLSSPQLSSAQPSASHLILCLYFLCSCVLGEACQLHSRGRLAEAPLQPPCGKRTGVTLVVA